jgi:AraC family transcriptional regulator
MNPSSENFISIFEQSPELLVYNFWKKKDHFLLNKDHYKRWVMFIPESGRFSFEILDQKGEAEFGDVVISPPDTDFHRQMIEPSTFHVIGFTWVDPSSFGDPNLVPRGKWKVRDTERLHSTLAYIKKTPGVYERPWRARFEHLLQDLLQLYLMETFAVAKSLRDIRDPVIERALDHFRKTAFDDTQIARYAESHGLTNVQFSRRFKRATGNTPIDFVTGLRLQKACKLLRTTNQTLASIAQECGYENGFYLSRIFLKKLKVRPSVYRNTHQV